MDKARARHYKKVSSTADGDPTDGNEDAASMSADSHRSHRQRMVREQVRARGIRDERLLAVLEDVPRERFVPVGYRYDAFGDRALPIDCGQTSSPPSMVAAMTAALDVRPEHRVLEIGTGSGYQTAILARLARTVYTVERIGLLLDGARERLESLGIRNVEYRLGDGSLGWPDHAPYDRILVTAGAPEVPDALVDQLVDAGRLVIPVGDEIEQMLTVVDRLGPKRRETPQFPCRFVKLIGQQGWRSADGPDGDAGLSA